jgi:hypothetical protein
MEKALNVGEACSPTGFESSFEGPGKGKRTSVKALVKAMVEASEKALLEAFGPAPILDRVHSG